MATVVISLFRHNPVQEAAERAYRQVVEHARQPAFFSECGVPDTVDGRFELICLHAFLYLNRLKPEQAQGNPLGQRFFDTMFLDLDRSLREMGVGDLSVGKHVKRMAQSFYGRVRAYEEGLANSDAMLKAALARNLFGTVAGGSEERLDAMAAYLRREVAALRRQPSADLLAGRLSFGLPPAAASAGGSTPPNGGEAR